MIVPNKENHSCLVAMDNYDLANCCLALNLWHHNSKAFLEKCTFFQKFRQPTSRHPTQGLNVHNCTSLYCSVLNCTVHNCTVHSCTAQTYSVLCCNVHILIVLYTTIHNNCTLTAVHSQYLKPTSENYKVQNEDCNFR